MYNDAKMIKNISNFLVALFRFCFGKQSRNLNFSEFFLPPKDPSEATFSETCAPTCKKHMCEYKVQ